MEMEFKVLYEKLEKLDKLEKCLERLKKMNQNNEPLTEKEQQRVDSLIHKAQEKAKTMTEEEIANDVKENLKVISDYIQRMEVKQNGEK